MRCSSYSASSRLSLREQVVNGVSALEWKPSAHVGELGSPDRPQVAVGQDLLRFRPCAGASTRVDGHRLGKDDLAEHLLDVLEHGRRPLARVLRYRSGDSQSSLQAGLIVRR